YFLHKNGHFWAAAQFMQRMEAIIYHIAASNIDNDLLLRITKCLVDCSDFDERLKMDIANAMANGDLSGFNEQNFGC
ncbi:MAG: death-on-curing protein, partial [Odoribacteraceae bacterium]|nr:death-on-curing protein [Odoribacteraceae bacterium]